MAAVDWLEVWARPLADGSLAVGLFNRTRGEVTVTVNWSDLGLSGPQPVRDLWLRQNQRRCQDDFVGLDITLRPRGSPPKDAKKSS